VYYVPITEMNPNMPAEHCQYMAQLCTSMYYVLVVALTCSTLQNKMSEAPHARQTEVSSVHF